MFSDMASEEVCPVCGCGGTGEWDVGVGLGLEVGGDDDAEVGLGSDVRDAAAADGGDMDDESFDGHQEAEETEALAALSWESYFDRYGWIG